MMRDPQAAAQEGNHLLKARADLKVAPEEEDPIAEAVKDLNLVMCSEAVNNVVEEAAREVAREAVKEVAPEEAPQEEA